MSNTLHKELKQPDKFATSVKNFFDQALKRQKVIISLLIFVFIVGLGITMVFTQKDARSSRARDALFQATQALEQELTVIAATPQPVASVRPDPAQVAHKKLDVSKELSRSIKLFEEVVSKYDGTRSSFDARLKLGDLYFDHGEPAKAISWYQSAVDASPGMQEKALALQSLGSAFENDQKPKEALSAFEKALGLGQEGLKGDLLLGAARSHEAMGDREKAKNFYQQIISQFPNSEFAKKAEIQQLGPLE